MDDSELRQRFRAGEEPAIRTVYERYGRLMFAAALTTLGSRELAADCVQEAFVKAWRGAAAFDPTRELGPWLTTITRRVAIDIYRREKRHLHPDSAAVPEPAEPTSLLDRVSDAWEIRAALDRLPPDEREVVRLSHVEQLTHAEIAERLDVPVGTVKSRSFRAHRRLVGLLGHMVEAAR